MICPVCEKNRVIFHVGGGKVLRIQCEGDFPTCKFEPETYLFRLMERVYYITTKGIQQEDDIREEFELKFRTVHNKWKRLVEANLHDARLVAKHENGEPISG